MYYRGQGIRKSSQLPRPRPDRILRSNFTAAVEKELESSTATTTYGKVPESTPVPESQGFTHHPESHVPTFQVESENLGHGVEAGSFAIPELPAQRRTFSTPDLRIWPSQFTELPSETVQGSLGASSEHLSPQQSGYRPLPSAMRYGNTGA